MKYLSISLIAAALCICSYFFFKEASSEAKISAQPITIRAKEIDAILSPGLDEVKKAIALRDKLLQDGIDFNKAAHIPELEAQLPIMEAYFRKAVENLPKKKKPLELIFKQLHSAFDKKRMSFQNWSGFHYQLASLFSDYAKADYIPENPFEMSRDFRWFVYEHEGILGLQTLNLAFIYGIEVIPLATKKELRADGNTYNPLIFAYHDRNHFSAFRTSPYAFPRFKESLRALYNKVESQSDPIERIRDHLVLFMFIHESLPYSNQYWESLEDLLQVSYRSMNSILRYRFGRNKDAIKHAIFQRIANSIVKTEGLTITKTSDQRYEIDGTSISTKQKTKFDAVVLRKEGGLVIQINETPLKVIVIDTADIQFADLDPVLKAVTAPGDYSELAVAHLMKDLGRAFLKKYAENEVLS